MSRMPKLPVDAMIRAAGFDDSEARTIRAAFNGRTGCLRASKPFNRIGREESAVDALWKASVNYVWRMLCFDFVSFAPHCCMPVTADWDLGAIYYRQYDEAGRISDAERDERHAKERDSRNVLDALIRRFEATVPVGLQAGAMRWARALGYVA